MTVVAGHFAWRELSRFLWRVGEYTESCADLIRELGIVQLGVVKSFVGERILRKIPRRRHRRSRRDQWATELFWPR